VRTAGILGIYCVVLVLFGVAIENVDPFWTDRGEWASGTLETLVGWPAGYAAVHLALGFVANRWWVLALPLLPLLLLGIFYLVFIPPAVLGATVGVALRRIVDARRASV
jgi:hypothetical protein